MSKTDRLLLLKRLHEARSAARATLAREIFYARLVNAEAEQEEEFEIKTRRG